MPFARRNEAPGISCMHCTEHSLLQGKFVWEEGGHLTDISPQNWNILLWPPFRWRVASSRAAAQSQEWMRLHSLKFCSRLASVPALWSPGSKNHESALPPSPAACSSAVRSWFQTFLCKQEGWKLLLQEWKLRFVFSLFVPSWDSNTNFTFVKRWINQESWQQWGVFSWWFLWGWSPNYTPGSERFWVWNTASHFCSSLYSEIILKIKKNSIKCI